MHTLLLKLSGPLQAWGSSSRFRSRGTEKAPTKSGVIGLIAAAQGLQRGEPLDDLAALRFAVRIDQPGVLLRDYQTAIDWNATTQAGRNPKLSTRYYLSDAVFVAAVGGDERMLADLKTALMRPQYPLFLGRRSCPANVDLVLGMRAEDPLTALLHEPWHASTSHMKTRDKTVILPILRDAKSDEVGDRQQDNPVSFSQEQRLYRWRTIVSKDAMIATNPLGREPANLFFSEVQEA